MNRLTILLLLAAVSIATAQQPTYIGRPGEGVSYLAVAMHPFADLEITDEQKAQMSELQKRIAEVVSFKVNPEDDLQLQRASYIANREDRKRVLKESSDKAFKLLTDKQKARAKQIKVQTDLTHGFINAVLETLQIQLNHEQFEMLGDELAFVRPQIEPVREQVKRRVLIAKVKAVIGEERYQRLAGETFDFSDQVIPRLGQPARIDQEGSPNGPLQGPNRRR